MVDLLPILAPYHRELMVVLACGDESRVLRSRLDPNLASARLGPWQATTWLDAVAKNLDPFGPVRLMKEGDTQNYIEVRAEGEIIRFAPFFGTIQNDRYFIHRKGPERQWAPSYDPSLFQFERDSEDLSLAELYAYALLVPSGSGRMDPVELHMFLGDQAANSASWAAGVRHHGNPYILRLEENGPLAPVEPVPFAPEPI